MLHTVLFIAKSWNPARNWRNPGWKTLVYSVVSLNIEYAWKAFKQVLNYGLESNSQIIVRDNCTILCFVLEKNTSQDSNSNIESVNNWKKWIAWKMSLINLLQLEFSIKVWFNFLQSIWRYCLCKAESFDIFQFSIVSKSKSIIL